MKGRSPKRNYSGNDANLLQQANLNLALLNELHADFVAKDENLDAAYLADYAAAIDAAENLRSDDMVRAQLLTLQQSVREVQAAVGRKMRQVRYHVLEAFGEDAAMQSKFGLPQWREVRRGVGNTLQALRILHAVALEHAAELDAVGFDAARIAEIASLEQDLEAATNAHAAFNNSRGTTTADRVAAYNGLHARISRVNALAQIVYADDYERRKQFTFDANVRKKKKTVQAPAGADKQAERTDFVY